MGAQLYFIVFGTLAAIVAIRIVSERRMRSEITHAELEEESKIIEEHNREFFSKKIIITNLSLTITCFLVLLLPSCASVSYQSDKTAGQRPYYHLVDFENYHDKKLYNRSSLYHDWGNNLKSINGIDENRVKIITDATSKVLQVRYPAGSCGPTDQAGCGKGGGAQWLVPLDLYNSFDKATLSYRIKFSDTFDFVLGGKLPGLTGAPKPLSMPPTGGHRSSDCNGFSARMMWRQGGAAVLYLYYPGQTGNYGDDFNFTDTNGETIIFIPGQWYTITQKIFMNTPGKSDGIIEIWLNNSKVLHKDGLTFRGISCRNIGINQFYFSTFFGGNDLSWASKKEEYILFDDFIISNE